MAYLSTTFDSSMDSYNYLLIYSVCVGQGTTVQCRTVRSSVVQYSPVASGSEVDLFVVAPVPALHCNQVMTALDCIVRYQ